MKILVIVVLVLLGLYWLFDHYAPLPLNHESFSLYAHNIHRVIGVVLLIAAVIVGLMWKERKKS